MSAHETIGVLAEIGRDLAARGWVIRCVPMWRRDVPWVEELAARIGPAAHVLHQWDDLPSLLTGIAECQVFVGMKLHSVVFASANLVPSLMIEYQPKCLDFQRSLGREAFTIRIDRLHTAPVLSMVDDLATGHVAHRLDLSRAVGRLQDRLRRFFSRLDHDVITPSAERHTLKGAVW